MLPDGGATLFESGFHADAGCYVREGEGWQVVVSSSEPLTAEDCEGLPDYVKDALPLASYVIEVNIEPYSAAAEAHEVALEAGRAMAKATGGVLEDPQGDSLVPL
jgi:hypothetical protein